jgi:transposase InsO family protein
MRSLIIPPRSNWCNTWWAARAEGKGVLELVMVILAVLTGAIGPSEAAAAMGVTRQTIHNKMRKMVLASVEALAGAQPGPRPLTKEKFDRLVAENKRLRAELSSARKRLACLEAALVFLGTLIRPLFSGALVEAYRRFTGPDKWRIVEAMRVLKAKGGRISEFSHLLGKSYRTLLRWYAKAAGRDGQEAIEALTDAYGGGVKTGYPDNIVTMVLELHREHPDWGPKKIAAAMADGPLGRRLAPNTVARIIKAYNDGQKPDPEKDRVRRRKLHTFGAPRRALCLDYVEVKIGQYKAKLCVAMDEFSRYIEAWQLVLNTGAGQALGLVREAFRRWGRSLIIKTDNGPEFREAFKQGLGQMGVYHLNSPLYYAPFNGKVERLFRAFRRFLSFRPPAMRWSDMESLIRQWVLEHNTMARHESLGWLTPWEVFSGKKASVIPEYVEAVNLRQGDKTVVLKFTRREGYRGRLELKLPESA